ncbi:DUF6252 family protein [Aquimarina agarivorans]|uniref:DUF6252 family protein n=1 Tax=Aquimarina agarivorans TaxID=980584 RepID=UPI000248EB05|nr:DUF6252 family protein [Aquimarina agarivorans]
MKKVIFIVSMSILLLVSCEKEASAGDFLDSNQIERLKIISDGVRDPETGLLIHQPTGGVIDEQTGIITDPETGLEIDPDSGVTIDPDGGTPPLSKLFAESGDLIGNLDGNDFNVRSFSAILDGTLLTINLIDENGNAITIAVNNPMTQPFSVNSAQNFTGQIDQSGTIFMTSPMVENSGFLQLIYDGETVSGTFQFTAFVNGADASSDSVEITGGSFAHITVE